MFKSIDDIIKIKEELQSRLTLKVERGHCADFKIYDHNDNFLYSLTDESLIYDGIEKAVKDIEYRLREVKEHEKLRNIIPLTGGNFAISLKNFDPKKNYLKPSYKYFYNDVREIWILEVNGFILEEKDDKKTR